MGSKTARAFAAIPGLIKAWLLPPPDEDPYTYWLRIATQKLRDSEFGIWQGFDTDGLPNFLKDKFDRMYWEWVDDPKYIRALRLLPGKTPAEAVDAFFDRLTAWRVDCDMTVQMSNLSAIRSVKGTAAFNASAGPAMMLRTRESSGLTTQKHYGRDKPTDPWRMVKEYVPPPPRSSPPGVAKSPFVYTPDAPLALTTEQLVAQAPTGSRVRWTNLAANEYDAYRHENCVKLGPDLYAAGGIDDPVTGNQFSRDRLEVQLALMTHPSPTQQYIRLNVYIDEIEVFDR